MSDVDVITKRCSKCGETRSLTEFSPAPRSRDGLHSWCKSCTTAGVKASQARRRALIGDEAFLAERRERQRAHRERTNNAYSRQYNRARWRALNVLAERHNTEYEHLFLLARRGEL